MKELQVRGGLTESHNTLSIDNLYRIFNFLNARAPKNAECYRDRVIFAVGLGTGLRTTALSALEMNQLRAERLRGLECIIFRSVAREMDRKSRTEQGRWRAVGE